jgi:predicted DNA-binding transcriptional regulator AlpA
LKVRVWSVKDIERARQLKRRRRATYGTLRTLVKEYSRPAVAKAQAHAPVISDEELMSPGKLALKRMLTDPGGREPRFVCMHMDEPLLTPKELAERLNVRESWIYEQTRSRAGAGNTSPLPHRKLMGRYLRFAWSEVYEWLNQLPMRDR